MNPDFADILSALSAAGVEFLIVGAHALAAHGVAARPPATSTSGCVRRRTTRRDRRALAAFGAPLAALSVEDLTTPDTVFQMALPPARIDIRSGITGVDRVDDAWRIAAVAPYRARRRTDGRRLSPAEFDSPQGPSGRRPKRPSRDADTGRCSTTADVAPATAHVERTPVPGAATDSADAPGRHAASVRRRRSGLCIGEVGSASTTIVARVEPSRVPSQTLRMPAPLAPATSVFSWLPTNSTSSGAQPQRASA